MNVVAPSDAKRWTASRRAISSNTLHGVTRQKHRGATNRRIHPRSLRWGLHKLQEQELRLPVAIEHRPHGQNDGQGGLAVLMVTRGIQRGGASRINLAMLCKFKNMRYESDSKKVNERLENPATDASCTHGDDGQAIRMVGQQEIRRNAARVVGLTRVAYIGNEGKE